MKVKVIKTGEWIDVCMKRRLASDVFIEYGTGKEYHWPDIALDSEDELGSYWFDKRNEYACMAMQAILSNYCQTVQRMNESLKEKGKDISIDKAVAEDAVVFANALVEELKKKYNG